MTEKPAVDGYVLRAHLTMKPEPAATFPGRVKAALPAIRKEPGTRQFECYTAYDDPAQFLMYEEFVDEAAFHAHRASPQTVALRDGLADTFATPPERTVWTQVRRTALPHERRDQPAGHVTAVLMRIKPECIPATVQEIVDTVAHMTGIVRFDLNQSIDDPCDFFVCARWVDRMAWEAHQKIHEYQAFTQRVAPNYAAPPNRTLWRSLP